MNPRTFQRFLPVLLLTGWSAGCSETTDPDDGSLDSGPLADALPQRFYVANTEGGTISVIDHRAREVVHTIDVGGKPHGHAPASTGDRIYATTDGGVGQIIAFDTRENSELWRLDVGSDMNEPHLTRDDRFLYAPDLLAANVVVVDVDDAVVVDDIPIVDESGNDLVALHNTYASHDGRWMYVTAILSQTIVRIDTATREIVRWYSLSGDPRPAAITEDDTKMYVQLSDLHGFIELDLESGEETAKIEWPEPTELPPGFEDADGLPTKCHGLGISPDGSELWAATNMESAVYVYSLPDLDQLDRIDIGDWPNWIAFTASGNTVYVTNSEITETNGTVSVIDRETRTVEATLDVGPVPKRIHRVDLPL